MARATTSLPDAALSGDQHLGVGSSHSLDLRLQFADRAACPDQIHVPVLPHRSPTNRDRPHRCTHSERSTRGARWCKRATASKERPQKTIRNRYVPITSEDYKGFDAHRLAGRDHPGAIPAAD